MAIKSFFYVISSILFLAAAAVFISRNRPEIYVVCLVFGFMFLFQAITPYIKK